MKRRASRSSLVRSGLETFRDFERIDLDSYDCPLLLLLVGGIDSPSVNAIDSILKQPVHITKYLCLNSKTSTDHYVNHLYERIVLTSHLCHSNVRQILSWYIADACLYSITGIIHSTLRHAIQSETFTFERIHRLSSQIIHGTIYLESKGLCPLTPWYVDRVLRICEA